MSEGSGVGDGTDATGSTGRAAHRSRPTGADGAPESDDSSASAPWERPRTWSSTPRLESTRVDDLLARLGEPEDQQDGRRSRRRSETGQTVPAHELLAAFEPAGAPSDPAEPDPAEPAETDPAETDLADPGIGSNGDSEPHPDPDSRSGDGPLPSAAQRGGRMAAFLSSAGSTPMELLTHRGGQPDADPSTNGQSGELGAGEQTEVIPTDAWPDEVTPVQPEPGPGDAEPEPDDPAGPQEAPADQEPVTDRDDPAADWAVEPAAAGAAGAAHRSGPVGRVRAPRALTSRLNGNWLHGSWLYAGRGVAAVLAVVVLAAFGINWRILDRAETGLAASQVDAINTEDSNIVRTEPTTAADSAAAPVVGSAGSASVPVVAPAKTFATENILLLGSDTRANGNGNAGNSDGNEGSAQSDTLMIAHLSADRQHVTIVSIPRDTKVDAPTCKKWDQVTGKVSDKTEPVSPGDRWKITNAYAVGGPTCTVAAVQKLTGLQIDRLLGIDFNGFKAMVDALGGITVDICKPIVDAELQTVAPSAGVQVIHGDEALSLVRARKVIGDQQSDLARIHRQQVVLSAILRQVSSAGTLLNPAKLDNFLQAFTKNTFNANIKLNDLVTLADSLGDLNPDRVTFYTLPTVPDGDDPDALTLDKTKGPAVFAALRTDARLPGEVPVTPSARPSPAVTPAATTSTPPASAAGSPRQPAASPSAAASSSVFDAFGSLGSASPVPGLGGSAGSSGSGPAATLKAGDLSAVNAGSRSCV